MRRLFKYFQKLFNAFQQTEMEELINWDIPTTKENVSTRFDRLKDAYQAQDGEFRKIKDLVANQPELVYGNYAVEGHNAYQLDKSYFGELELKEINGNLYKANWKIGFEGQGQKGMGFLYEDKLALDFYYSEEGQRYYGLVIYQVGKDNTLTGYWVEPGVEGVGFEECHFKNAF